MSCTTSSFFFGMHCYTFFFFFSFFKNYFLSSRWTSNHPLEEELMSQSWLEVRWDNKRIWKSCLIWRPTRTNSQVQIWQLQICFPPNVLIFFVFFFPEKSFCKIQTGIYFVTTRQKKIIKQNTSYTHRIITMDQIKYSISLPYLKLPTFKHFLISFHYPNFVVDLSIHSFMMY
jgi:hypothetical protein